MRFALVGCGGAGRKRAASLGGGHSLTIVCDADPSRAASLAAGRGGTEAAEVVPDWRVAVASSGADAVLVATPHHLLAPVAAAAMRAGKPVLVEKPAARSLAEAEELGRLAERCGVVLRVGLNHRYHPAIGKARQLLAEGAIGPPMLVRGRYGHGGRPGYESEWRAVPEIAGGGELVDQGMHLIDLSRWFLGELRTSGSFTRSLFWKMPVEDNAFLFLETASGRAAWLHVSWTEWKNLFSLEVFGRQGKLEVEGLGRSYGPERLTLHRMEPEMGAPETTSWDFPDEDRSWDLELADFVESAAGRPGAGATIDDAIAAWKVVDAAYRGEPG